MHVQGVLAEIELYTFIYNPSKIYTTEKGNFYFNINHHRFVLWEYYLASMNMPYFVLHFFYLRLSPDVTMKNSNGFLQDSEAAYSSRTAVFTPGLLVGSVLVICLALCGLSLFCFMCARKLPVSLVCLFLIAPSGFCDLYLSHCFIVSLSLFFILTFLLFFFTGFYHPSLSYLRAYYSWLFNTNMLSQQTRQLCRWGVFRLCI